VSRGLHLGERVFCFTEASVVADLRQDGIPTGEDVLPIEELWGPGATPNASGMVRRRSGERDKSPRGCV